MKKSFFVFLLIAAILSGCGAAPAETSAPPSAATAVPEGRPDAPAPTPGRTVPPYEADTGRVQVGFVSREEMICAEDGETPLLDFSIVRVMASFEGRPDVDMAVNMVLEGEQERFTQGEPDKEGLSGKEGFLAAAREEYAYRQKEFGSPENMQPYILRRSASVHRADSRVLSLSFADSTYSGGAHGYTFHHGWNFDSRTGQLLTLDDLAEDPTAFREAAVEQLKDIAGGGEYAMAGFFDDYVNYLPDLLRDNNWYFDENGLVFLANAYELAPYASGLITLTLPYAWLQWHIKNEFLPPASAADGTLLGEKAERDTFGTFIVDDGTEGKGARIRFTAQGRVEDVRLQIVAFEDWGTGFSFRPEEERIFFSFLEDGESLDILTWIPDAAPRLSISWRDGEGRTQTRYITESGKDGSLVLMDALDYASLPMEITDLLPLTRDLDGDYIPETLDLRPMEENGSARWQLTVDGVPLPGGISVMDADRISLWLCDLDMDGVCEILLSGDMGSDDYMTCGWHGDTLLPILFTGETRYGQDGSEQTKTVDGKAVFSGGFLVLESWYYQLGTNAASRAYAMEESGILAPWEYTDWMYRRNSFWLAVKEGALLPVTWDDAGPAVLTAGEELLLLGSDGDTARFTTRDGRTGTISLTFAGWEGGIPWTIEGKGEEEYFIMLPYVG